MILLTIKKRADFVLISKNNISFRTSSLLLLARKTPEKYLKSPKTGEIIDFCRVGFTITKAIGSAVIRNKIKRRYREAFTKLFKTHALNHFDYVLIARKSAALDDYQKIYNDLKFCLKGINKLTKNDQNKS